MNWGKSVSPLFDSMSVFVAKGPSDVRCGSCLWWEGCQNAPFLSPLEVLPSLTWWPPGSPWSHLLGLAQPALHTVVSLLPLGAPRTPPGTLPWQARLQIFSCLTSSFSWGPSMVPLSQEGICNHPIQNRAPFPVSDILHHLSLLLFSPDAWS